MLLKRYESSEVGRRTLLQINHLLQVQEAVQLDGSNLILYATTFTMSVGAGIGQG